ncbi:MAG: NAD(P)/FAD-dependent oxidoreductase [Phycisphaerales bacterium]|nr:NAD(P)/FAD-dependent oxidoreductase [Phycisphaerales bacterium]
MPNRRSEISAEVAIIGSGPAGLAAAAQLARLGVTDIIVVERDDAPGGLPRFCHHPGFGWEYSRRFDSGPRFVRRLLAGLPSTTRLLLRTTALRISPGSVVEIIGPETGLALLRAKAILVATGIREQPRGARLVPGSRPERGVLTTGLLQQLIARGVRIGARRMAVVGSEHVAFSAILTGWRAGLRTVALVESSERIQSWPAAGLLARAMGIPLFLRSTIAEILGSDRVEAIAVRNERGQVQRIDCDSVLFSGSWVPETVLIAESGGLLDPHSGGPVVDQYLRTTLPGVFAAGNVLRAIESSGQAAREGAIAGRALAALIGKQTGPDIGTIRIDAESPLSYVVPQRWALPPSPLPATRFSFRSRAELRGRIAISVGGTTAYQSKPMRIRANRQLRLSADGLNQGTDCSSIRIGIMSRW